jgi:Xaa-Pro aminopeptidase
MENTRNPRIIEAFTKRGEDYHGIICRLPQNVVMFTGYQPILGNSFCFVSVNPAEEVEVRLVVPEDEKDLVPPGVAVDLRTYSVETMDFIGDVPGMAYVPLDAMLGALHIRENAVIGYEGIYSTVAPAYTQMGVPGHSTIEMYHKLFLAGFLRDATPLIEELGSIKTEQEINAIKRSELVAYEGFKAAREAIRVGATEADVASATLAALLRAGYATSGAYHVLPYVHVMAGPRSALAYRAFNLTSNAVINLGDPVLVQMEVCVNGYWAELTRTFFAGGISNQWRDAHQACVIAQDAALTSIHAGVAARDVDAAARSVLQDVGLGAAFKHGLGHGVGFQAINHNAPPILHPASKDILQPGMAHNVEPAVYLEGKGGIRLNDNVVDRELGCERLSAIVPRDLDWLVVR